MIKGENERDDKRSSPESRNSYVGSQELRLANGGSQSLEHLEPKRASFDPTSHAKGIPNDLLYRIFEFSCTSVYDLLALSLVNRQYNRIALAFVATRLSNNRDPTRLLFLQRYLDEVPRKNENSKNDGGRMGGRMGPPMMGRRTGERPTGRRTGRRMGSRMGSRTPCGLLRTV